MIDVYTDGSCYPNPGPGGWAWAVDENHWRSGYARSSTNNRMEITAAFAAVKHIPGDLNIHSDSKYVVDTFNEEWWVKWERKAWMDGKRPRLNVDLWKPFIELVKSRNITFTWVKGHNGLYMNEFVDELCGTARKDQGSSVS